MEDKKSNIIKLFIIIIIAICIVGITYLGITFFQPKQNNDINEDNTNIVFPEEPELPKFNENMQLRIGE